LSGTQSISFKDNTPEPYESWTYDIPAGLQTGKVELWFRSDLDTITTVPSTWGGAFLIEDANNRADFGAVEISTNQFGPFVKWWATEGVGDRLVANDRFDSNSLPNRNNTWNKVTFDISTTATLIAVNDVYADEVAAPGSNGGTRTLRFRHVAGSPINGGVISNYITTPTATLPTRALPRAVFVDDFSVQQILPTPLTKGIGFELTGVAPNQVADYDFPAIQSVAPKNDVVEQSGFVNKFVQTTGANQFRTGTGGYTFDPGAKRLRKIEFDLSSVPPSGGVITLSFYDTLGQNTARDKFGGSVLIQSGTNPTEWIGAEIWNFNFPFGGGPYNYYSTRSTGATTANFSSGYYGPRSIGWQTIAIDLSSTSSKIRVNGQENRNNLGLRTGPGLTTNPKLVILADSASQGGSKNFVGIDELEQVYEFNGTSVTFPYVYYDNLVIPAPLAGVSNWAIYE
jgi:hypothetical protein